MKLAQAMAKTFTRIGNEENNPYFQTSKFDHILDYFKHNHHHCQIKDLNGKLIFRTQNIASIRAAIDQCQRLI